MVCKSDVHAQRLFLKWVRVRAICKAVVSLLKKHLFFGEVKISHLIEMGFSPGNFYPEEEHD